MTTPATPLPAKPAPPPLVRQILLTGARGGIGRATAARLADTGHVVFAGARRADQLQALAATHPGIRPVVLGITDQASIDRDAWPAPGAAAGWAVPGGQTTISGPVADQAACTARPPRPATWAVSCSRCAAATRRPTWRSRGAASTDPTARAGTAAARQLRAGTVPSPGRPSTTQHDPGDRFLTCNLFAALTNAARRNHHVDLASRQDVLRAQLLGGARATQDHQQAIGIAN
jgi:NAD(P)-dependent dehydrogenase (short-subunit alcohol dehydrogenase family)